jgi:hypothetical protein
MFAVSWPGSDANLVFSAPFGGLSSFVRTLAVLGAFGLGFFLLGWLYRAESKLIPRRFRIALLTLRLLAFALVLGTLLFEPVLSKTVREDVPGKVVIALDTSDSMRVSDPHRTPRQKLHLARTLKLLPDVGDATLRDFETRCHGADGPEFGLGALDSDKKQYADIMNRLDAIPRLEHALKVLDPDGLDLVAKLRAKHAVEVVGFGQELTGLPLDAEKRRAAVPAGALDPAKVASPVYTDMKLPLARAAETAGDGPDAAGPKLLGVVFLSDGRHNWGEGPAARVADLAARKASVSSIILAPIEPPPDVAVVQARASSATVFKGSTVPVEIAVRVTGMPPGDIPVKLTPPDGKPVTDVIRHNGQDQVHQLSLKVTLDEPGPQVLTVTADPPPTDRFPANNTRTTRVNVVKDRARVMLIDGEARWEFHYLHTCLGRDPNMDVRSVVFRQPRIGRVSDEELKKTGTPARSMPDDAEVLSAYDCVVLGDAEPGQLSPAWRERIEKYVAEAGGTLVLSAGKRAMPLAYSGTEDDPLRKLLPIKSPKVIGSEEGFSLDLTAEGERAWFLAMGDSPTESKRAWGRFPPHFWAVAGVPKDGAEVLATVPGGNPKTDAIIVRQNYGFGRVLYVGIDSTWRWRFKEGDYHHHRFWGQVAQWAASDRLLPTSNADGTIRFGTREPAYASGQNVEVVVWAAESLKKLRPGALKGARIVRLPEKPGAAEVPSGLIPLVSPEGRPRDLAGAVKDLVPGRYAVELEIPDWADKLQGPPGPDGRFAPLRSRFEVLPPENEELVDLGANLPLMEEMAEATGGRVYSIDEVDSLVEALSQQTAVRETRVDRPLRMSWWVLGTFLLLLTLEWALRKWAGLP